MATPEEIAREIADKWLRFPQFTERYEQCVKEIASALAASQQRGESAETRALLMTNRAVNAEAQLQASKQENKRLKEAMEPGTPQRIFMGLYEMGERHGASGVSAKHIVHQLDEIMTASERALERVRGYVAERLTQHRANLEGWKSGGYLTPTEPDADERARIRDRLRVAIYEGEMIQKFGLASPGSPQEGKKQVSKRKTVIHVCSFDSTGDLRGKKLTYENVKRIVLAEGRFSVFEASATDRHAAIFTRLCRDPEIETDNKTVGYPWTLVRLKAGSPQEKGN